MAIEPITDHATDGLRDLLAQHRRPVIEALLTTWLTRLQLVEDEAHKLLAALDIDQAEGALLDAHGAWVQETRDGRADAEYRLAIKAQGSLYRSRGTVNDLLTALRILLDDSTATAEYRQEQPAGYTLEVEAPAGFTEAQMQRAMQDLLALAPAGVCAHHVYHLPANDPAFRFDTAGAGLNDGALWSLEVSA